MLADIGMEVAATRGLTGRDALDARVMQAMRKVPRDKFVPRDLQRFAFDNGPFAHRSSANHFPALYRRPDDRSAGA